MFKIGMTVVSVAIVSTVGDALAEDRYGAIVERQASALVEEGLVPAIVVGILRDGEREFHGLGAFSADDERKPSKDTLFEIGSISKVFTALLLAEAERRGELSIDDPLSKHLPEGVRSPALDGEEIRLWHLASHLSGLPRIPFNMTATTLDNPYEGYEEEHLWAFLERCELVSKPGETYAYSNLGAGLLGTILARTAGVSYEWLVEQRITAPLGMDDTAITLDDGQTDRFAPPHHLGGAASTNWTFDALAGAGAIRSTADDLLTFAEAQLDPGDSDLAPSFAMIAKRRAKAGDPTSIALGWHIAGDGSTLVHSGGTNGYRSSIFVDPRGDTAVVVLANATEERIPAVAEKILQEIIGIPAEPIAVAKKVEVDDVALDRLVGTYASDQLGTYEITRDGKRLLAKLGPQPAFEVFATSDTEFFYRVVDARIVFDLPEDGGDAETVTLFQNGMELHFNRKDR